MDPKVAQMLQALGFFKDWTNYLLVTTVAALGWVATKPVLLTPVPLSLTIGFLCASIVFGIFTLALIPIIGQKITSSHTTFYDVDANFKLVWLWGPERTLKLKSVCWLQHVFFLAGIVIFGVASISKAVYA